MWVVQEQEFEFFWEQLEGVNCSIEEVEVDMKILGVSFVQVEFECWYSKFSIVECEQVLCLKSCVVELLFDGIVNFVKLQFVVENSVQWVIYLVGQWEKYWVLFFVEYCYF